MGVRERNTEEECMCVRVCSCVCACVLRFSLRSAKP